MLRRAPVALPPLCPCSCRSQLRMGCCRQAGGAVSTGMDACRTLLGAGAQALTGPHPPHVPPPPAVRATPQVRLAVCGHQGGHSLPCSKHHSGLFLVGPGPLTGGSNPLLSSRQPMGKMQRGARSVRLSFTLPHLCPPCTPTQAQPVQRAPCTANPLHGPTFLLRHPSPTMQSRYPQHAEAFAAGKVPVPSLHVFGDRCVHCTRAGHGPRVTRRSGPKPQNRPPRSKSTGRALLLTCKHGEPPTAPAHSPSPCMLHAPGCLPPPFPISSSHNLPRHSTPVGNTSTSRRDNIRTHCVELAEAFEGAVVIHHPRGHSIPTLQPHQLAVLRAFLATFITRPLGSDGGSQPSSKAASASASAASASAAAGAAASAAAGSPAPPAPGAPPPPAPALAAPYADDTTHGPYQPSPPRTVSASGMGMGSSTGGARGRGSNRRVLHKSGGMHVVAEGGGRGVRGAVGRPALLSML